MQTERRSSIKKLFASAIGMMGLGVAAKASTTKNEKEVGNITEHQEIPLFSGHTIHGDMVYIAGKGAHVAPFDIRNHTEIVLQELEKELIAAGSSMKKVL
jgi:2-iminobutanoate/2-iminopropanoate deaminase